MRHLLSVITALAKAAWRGWRARPFLTLLNVLALAIGTAVYLAIQIVNHSATRSFQAGIDLVAGRSDLEITAPGGVGEEVFLKLSGFPGIKAATPVLEGYATVDGSPGEYLRIIGTDPFTAGPFFGTEDNSASAAWRGSTESWLAEDGTLVISSAWAEQMGLETGSPLRLTLDGKPREVRIAGTFPEPEDRPSSRRTAFLDIGWAQELLDRPGHLSSIQIIAENPLQAGRLAQALNSILPPGTTAQAPALRNRQVSLMLQGFQLNLTALSLVSLLVGVFLISSTIAASVVRQRREIGIMRSIGASRTQVRSVFLAEAAFSALAGALLGIPLARLMAAGLLDGAARTISAHYVLLSIDRAWVSPVHVMQAVGCGLAAALAGAWVPAREASAVNPVEVLRPGRNLEPRPVVWWKPLLPAALLFTLTGMLSWLALHHGPAWLSFAACLSLVTGGTFLARPALHLLTSLSVRTLPASGPLLFARMGAASLGQSLHRAVPVTAALMTAVAMVLGVSIMIHSFRGTLHVWVDSTLKADLYIAPAANEVVKGSATLPSGLVETLRAHPLILHVETMREETARLPDGSEYTLRAVDRPVSSPPDFVSGNPQEQQTRWRLPDHIAASEVLAGRMGWTGGETLTLTTPGGPRNFMLSGIFHDYSDDRGSFWITRENHVRHWPEAGFHAAAVFLKDPSRAPQIETEVRRTFSPDGALSIFLNQSLRNRVFEIFDQTFAVTRLLRVIAVTVAVLGITLSLGTLVAERAWEIAALRAIGAGRGQIALIQLMEAGLVGFISAVLGMGCGLLLSLILTWVVNRAFFGWTVRFGVPWAEWALTPLWVVPAAVLAGLLPAWRAASTDPAPALRSS